MIIHDLLLVEFFKLNIIVTLKCGLEVIQSCIFSHFKDIQRQRMVWS